MFSIKRKPKAYPKVLDICEAFIALSKPGTENGINYKKLPLLLYYAQVISLSVCNRELFSDDMTTGGYGVIIGHVYYEYKRTPVYSHYHEHREWHDDFLPSRTVQLESADRLPIHLAWQLYGHKSVRYLQRKIGRELSCMNTRCIHDESYQRLIQHDWITCYYKDKYLIKKKKTVTLE